MPNEKINTTMLADSLNVLKDFNLLSESEENATFLKMWQSLDKDAKNVIVGMVRGAAVVMSSEQKGV